MPELGEKVAKLLSLKEKYRRFFYEGEYVCEERPNIPLCVKHGEFKNGNDVMYALWNDSRETVKFNLLNKEITRGMLKISLSTAYSPPLYRCIDRYTSARNGVLFLNTT